MFSIFLLAEYLPDALKTNCRKCNEKQREGAIKVVRFLEKNRPDDWKKLLDKWDPKRTLFEDFKKNHKDIYDKVFEKQ